jgi:hypothetical protein
MVLLVKVPMILWLDAGMDRTSPAGICGWVSRCDGDSPSYIEPVENLLRTGTYYWDNSVTRVYAGRMPHYGLIYGAFRLALPPMLARDAVVVLQLLLDSLATVAIAVLALRWSGSALAAWLALVLAGLSLHASHYTIRILPESLSISTMAFLLLSTDRAMDAPPRRWLPLPGIAGAVLVALKPYATPLIVFLACVLAVHRAHRARVRPRDEYRTLLSFVLPLLALLLPWTVRNALSLGAFIPLQQDLTAGYAYASHVPAYRRFIGSWGGTTIWWDKRSAGCYFEPREGYPCEYVLPDHALSRRVNARSIESARILLLEAATDPRRSAEATAAFSALADAYRADRPASYLLLAPLRLAAGMVVHSGSYFLPRDPSWLGLAFKALQSVIYYLVLSGGAAGLALCLIRSRRPWLAAAVPLYLIAVFAFVLRIAEYRYFDLAWPGLIIGVALLLSGQGRQVAKVRAARRDR